MLRSAIRKIVAVDGGHDDVAQAHARGGRGDLARLERVEGIAQNAQAVSSNAAALSSVFATTLGGPAIKVAAFSYGIRRAAQNRRRAEAENAARVATKADVHFDKVEGGFAIQKIVLHCQASVPGLDKGTFDKIAGETKKACPVSKALAAVPIELDATLTA